MDCIVHGVKKSWTQLTDFHFHFAMVIVRGHIIFFIYLTVIGFNCDRQDLLSYSMWNFTSLVAQLVKNPPAMRETWVRSMGWEDPLEKGKATHASILA